jgi:prophage regulatory protein
MNNEESYQELGFYRVAQILKIVPISRAKFWEMVKNKNAPPGYKISKNCTGWKKSEIHKWIASMTAKTGGKQ